MDGLISGQLSARAVIAKQLSKEGDTEGARKERQRPAVVPKRMQKAVVDSALSEGRDFVGDLEKRAKDVLREQVTASQTNGLEVNWPAVGKLVREVLMETLEPVPRGAELAFATPARRVQARSIEDHRRNQANLRVWRTQQRELRDWQAGRRTEPVWRTRARQQTTRMRTGWNRWHNQGSIQRAQEAPAISYLMFTLGEASEHTQKCLSRAGWLIRKNSPALLANRPPLHWGCKSRLVPMTTERALASGGTFLKPPATRKKDAKPDPEFLVAPIRQGR